MLNYEQFKIIMINIIALLLPIPEKKIYLITSMYTPLPSIPNKSLPMGDDFHKYQFQSPHPKDYHRLFKFDLLESSAEENKNIRIYE
jgi:hypothetical protein